MKVIFVTGYADFEYAQTAIRLGAFDYLLKPIDEEKLGEVLECLLEIGGGQEEPESDIPPTTPVYHTGDSGAVCGAYYAD